MKVKATMHLMSINDALKAAVNDDDNVQHYLDVKDIIDDARNAAINNWQSCAQSSNSADAAERTFCARGNLRGMSSRL
jgi:hypothetical protein